GTAPALDVQYSTASTGPYPWPIWTGAIPAVPPSRTGKTYYVDNTHGNDGNAGTTTSAAFATIARAVRFVAPGDTVLIRQGFYREGIDLTNAPSGTADQPITFGTYGDGKVILDVSTPIGSWTRVSGSVWRAPVSFKPIGIVVNEVPLRQVCQGQNSGTP